MWLFVTNSFGFFWQRKICQMTADTDITDDNESMYHVMWTSYYSTDHLSDN